MSEMEDKALGSSKKEGLLEEEESMNEWRKGLIFVDVKGSGVKVRNGEGEDGKGWFFIRRVGEGGEGGIVGCVFNNVGNWEKEELSTVASYEQFVRVNQTIGPSCFHLGVSNI